MHEKISDVQLKNFLASCSHSTANHETDYTHLHNFAANCVSNFSTSGEDGVSSMEGEFRRSFQCHQTVRFLQEKYNKNYKSSSEMSKAFYKYQEAKRETEEHNQKYKRGEVSFSRTLNMFADLPRQQRLKIASGFRQPQLTSVIGRNVKIITAGSLPTGPFSLDWRTKGVVSPVKDQGFFCNCCWAFSAVATLESLFLMKYGKLHNISEQNLIDCNRNTKTGNWGCDGGSQGSAYSYIQENGIESTETYPYEEDLPHKEVYPCRFNSSNSIGRISGYTRCRPKNETLLRDLVAIRPVAFAFDGSLDSFMYYNGGIYDDPKCPMFVNRV